jgi:hypothetical protein
MAMTGQLDVAPGIRWVLNLEDRDTPTLCRCHGSGSYPQGAAQLTITSSYYSMLYELGSLRGSRRIVYKLLFSRARVSGVHRTSQIISVRGEPHGVRVWCITRQSFSS